MTINITGKVLHGQGYGKVLGFPTANLDRRSFSRRKLKIRLGVYGGYAQISPPPNLPPPSSAKDTAGKQGGGKNRFPSLEGRGQGRVYKAAIVIGPIDKQGLPKIEAHLIGFKGNLYNTYLYTYLYTYIRPFKKFSSEGELKRQIKKDIQRIKKSG